MKASVLAGLILIAGCTPTILMDPKGSTHPENYFSDKAECETIVGTQHSPTQRGFRDFGVGALVGGAAGAGAAATGLVSQPTGYAAIAGAVTTGLIMSVMGVSAEMDIENRLVVDCLKGRGYSILQ